MKVNIGPYRNCLTSNVHSNYMNKHYGLDWPEYGSKGLINKVAPLREYFLERLEDTLQWIYDHSINLYLERKQRKIKIRIDRYDTWSMDDTLALIILPMLKQIKDSKHGAPYVDPDDCPKDLRPKEQDEYGTDDTHFARWEYVLDEMIYAFKQKNTDDWESQYYEYNKWDMEGMQVEQERISNGFRLFGKYYEGLWD